MQVQAEIQAAGSLYAAMGENTHSPDGFGHFDVPEIDAGDIMSETEATLN